MEFKVMSRQNARQYSYNENIKDCIIVSITDKFSVPNEFCENPHIKGICRVQFNDEESVEKQGITKKDAKKILDFVFKYKDGVDEIIVHCEAGVSRSAGVCAALMLIINGDDSPIFDSWKYSPNMFCYRTVLNEHFGELNYDEELANEKINHNLELWKEANDIW